eukprot:4430793-Pleurochrysis_carterae.AAC.2
MVGRTRSPGDNALSNYPAGNTEPLKPRGKYPKPLRRGRGGYRKGYEDTPEFEFCMVAPDKTQTRMPRWPSFLANRRAKREAVAANKAASNDPDALFALRRIKKLAPLSFGDTLATHHKAVMSDPDLSRARARRPADYEPSHSKLKRFFKRALRQVHALSLQRDPSGRISQGSR